MAIGLTLTDVMNTWIGFEKTRTKTLRSRFSLFVRFWLHLYSIRGGKWKKWIFDRKCEEISWRIMAKWAKWSVRRLQKMLNLNLKWWAWNRHAKNNPDKKKQFQALRWMGWMWIVSCKCCLIVSVRIVYIGSLHFVILLIHFYLISIKNLFEAIRWMSFLFSIITYVE